MEAEFKNGQLRLIPNPNSNEERWFVSTFFTQVSFDDGAKKLFERPIEADIFGPDGVAVFVRR